MRYLLTIILVIALNIVSYNSLALSDGLEDNTRINNGHLLPCDQTYSCVVSQGNEQQYYISPLVYHTNLQEAKETLVKVLTVVPKTTVIEITDNYIRAESKSKILGIIDDVEFYFSADDKVIHVRSASRQLKFDLGVNRRRLEQIRLALKDLNI